VNLASASKWGLVLSCRQGDKDHPGSPGWNISVNDSREIKLVAIRSITGKYIGKAKLCKFMFKSISFNFLFTIQLIYLRLAPRYTMGLFFIAKCFAT
jgi:hypothetical protein